MLLSLTSNKVTQLFLQNGRMGEVLHKQVKMV